MVVYCKYSKIVISYCYSAFPIFLKNILQLYFDFILITQLSFLEHLVANISFMM